ncbi:hypothetical protein [Actinomyces trachealis]|uniref:hypothetical protein n=1 Tax=Actinomyces trachealis TaxID=2763540 RepID=UPI0018929B7E|nr:hypothetical protein [Actinomyces trachealis]
MSIDTSKLPALNLDVASLRTNASDLKTKAGDVRTSGASLNTTWGGMSSCYKAPEQETLYGAMKPVETDCDSLADNLESIAGALSTFADTADQIKKDSENLKSRADSFLTSISGDAEWQYDQDKVDKHNGFLNEANALQIRMWDAERTCANAIRALDCLVAYHADPTSDDDQFAYGLSKIPDGTAGLPWGEPVERQDHCPKKAGVSIKRAVWDDFCLGTVNGLTNLVGFKVGGPDWGFSWETFSNTWSGLSTLVGAGYDEYGNFTGFSWSNAGNSWKGLVKGCLHWDEWKTDPLRALTGTVLDVGSLLIPVVGEASKVQKFGKAGSALEKVGKAAQVADKVLSFMDPLGTLAGKAVSKVAGPAVDLVKNALKIDFSLPDLIGKWTKADVSVHPETRTVSGTAGARVPEASTSAGAGSSAAGDNIIGSEVKERFAEAKDPSSAHKADFENRPEYSSSHEVREPVPVGASTADRVVDSGTHAKAGGNSASEPAHAAAGRAHTDASAHGATGGHASHSSGGTNHGAGSDVGAGGDHHGAGSESVGHSGEPVTSGGGHDAGPVAERGGLGAGAADGAAGGSSHGHTGDGHAGGDAGGHAGGHADNAGHGDSGNAARRDADASQHHEGDASDKGHPQQGAHHSADHADDAAAHGSGDGHASGGSGHDFGDGYGAGDAHANGGSDHGAGDGDRPLDGGDDVTTSPADPRNYKMEDGTSYDTQFAPEQVRQELSTYERLKADLAANDVRMADGSEATVEKVREVAGKSLNELTVGDAKLLRKVNDIRAFYTPDVLQKVVEPTQLLNDFTHDELNELVSRGVLEEDSVEAWRKAKKKATYPTSRMSGSVAGSADANVSRSEVDLNSSDTGPMKADDGRDIYGLDYDGSNHRPRTPKPTGGLERHSQIEVRMGSDPFRGKVYVPDADMRTVMDEAANYVDLDAIPQDANLWEQLPQSVQDRLKKGGESDIAKAVNPDNPWRGTGFAGSMNSPNIATPELKIDVDDYVNMADVGPAEMWVRGYDGSQELLAVFKEGKWVLAR